MSAEADSSPLPPEAYAAAMADLPGMGPARLVSLLRQDPPELVWRQIVSGEVRRPDPSTGHSSFGPRANWADLAARRDVGRRWDAVHGAGIQVAYFGGPLFPALLVADPEPPGVVFWLGDLGVLARPRVAIIGTRQCTSYGRSVAAELGRDLSRCGICVVSGLALGIDGAAHHGALAAEGGAGPLGVAASGVDTPYPKRHAELWRRVAAGGAVISEAAPRQPAQTWRFPARNRLIAALSCAVVVVESHASGGSMLTVAAAADRGIDVLAVPGPVTSAASAGTNQLLYEGLGPVRHAGDVLAALGDLRPWPPDTTGRRPNRAAPETGGHSRGATPSSNRAGVSGAGRTSARGRESEESGRLLVPPPRQPAPRDGLERRVIGAVDRTPTSTSVIAERTGLPIGTLSVVLLRLEAHGCVRGEGGWWERCDEQ